MHIFLGGNVSILFYPPRRAANDFHYTNKFCPRNFRSQISQFASRRHQRAPGGQAPFYNSGPFDGVHTPTDPAQHIARRGPGRTSRNSYDRLTAPLLWEHDSCPGPQEQPRHGIGDIIRLPNPPPRISRVRIWQLVLHGFAPDWEQFRTCTGKFVSELPPAAFLPQDEIKANHYSRSASHIPYIVIVIILYFIRHVIIYYYFHYRMIIFYLFCLLFCFILCSDQLLILSWPNCLYFASPLSTNLSRIPALVLHLHHPNSRVLPGVVLLQVVVQGEQVALIVIVARWVSSKS